MNRNLEYWLVKVNKGDKPCALVKLANGKAQVLAGDNRGLIGFSSETANVFQNHKWERNFLTKESSHPILGVWIDKLGPVTNSETRLKTSRKRLALIERARSLKPGDLDKIRQLKLNGVSRRKIAEMFSISDSFIQRMKL